MGPSARASSAFAGVPHWTLMAMAMMAPVALPAARHVGLNSIRRRHQRAIGLYLGVYVAVWAGFGAVAQGAVQVVRDSRAGCSRSPPCSWRSRRLRARVAPMAQDPVSARVDELVGAAVDSALARLEAAREEPYYDEAADRSARDRYYEGLDAAVDGESLRAGLAALLERTHGPRLAYKPMQWVYPRVDLHPDGILRSIYSGKTFSPEELIEADAEIERARTQRMLGLNLRETALGPSELRAEAAAIEDALPYNCEHVVCQSWFAENEPMRGDLHHLFACESGCNSFRGNFPYLDFPDTEEVVRPACGRREEDGFEPGAGKGPVARATLYFLLRYPRVIGDGEREFTPDRLEMVLGWHEADPVSDYERHRNHVIAELQGDRNPLIDHPDWARRIDFAAAWA
jgi:endonuclease G, mitochondrial